MKLHLSGSKDRMTRREFLMRIHPKKDVRVIINKEKCTGCGLCLVDCPTQALSLSRGAKEDVYQFLFRSHFCDACGVCKRSCPEHCLELEEKIGENSKDKETEVIFEDKVCRCIGCGTPLFAQAMVKSMETKVFASRKPTWSFNLCPSCRVKSHFEGKKIE